MNLLIREIESLLKKPVVQKHFADHEESILLKLILREFEMHETDGAYAVEETEDRIACYVLTFKTFESLVEVPEGRRLWELAEKQMTHLPLFPNEKTEEKMVLVSVPRYCNRKLLREIFANTKITKTDAAKIAEILTDYKNRGNL